MQVPIFPLTYLYWLEEALTGCSTLPTWEITTAAAATEMDIQRRPRSIQFRVVLLLGGIHILRRQPRGEGGQKNAYFTK